MTPLFPLRASLFLFSAVVASAATWNVRDFGATGDGATKDTAAFQHALDACAVDGGGEVLVPAGKYLIGSIQLGQRTTLRLADDSLLLGSPDLADYPLLDIRWEGRWQPGHRALIHAADVDHIAIVGRGTIEGNAATAASNRPPRGTLVLEAIHCTDVRWENFSVRQPGNNWATHPTFCRDVTIKNLTIRGQRDGIDVDSCQGVRIEHCDIQTGDDSISLKSGRGLDGARLGAPTADVLIADCTLADRRFACIGIGSEISAGVRNVRIERCRFTAATYAIYLKSRVGRGGRSENISGRDLDIHGGGFLRVNLATAGNNNTADDPVPGSAGIPSAAHLVFAGVRLDQVKVVADLTQIPAEAPIAGLELRGISGRAEKGVSIRHAREVVLADLTVEVATAPRLAIDDVTGRGLDGAVSLPPAAARP